MTNTSAMENIFHVQKPGPGVCADYGEEIVELLIQMIYYVVCDIKNFNRAVFLENYYTLSDLAGAVIIDGTHTSQEVIDWARDLAIFLISFRKVVIDDLEENYEHLITNEDDSIIFDTSDRMVCLLMEDVALMISANTLYNPQYKIRSIVELAKRIGIAPVFSGGRSSTNMPL